VEKYGEDRGQEGPYNTAQKRCNLHVDDLGNNIGTNPE